MQISDHLKGILLTTAGVLTLSPDAVLMRLLHAETLTVLFWRGITLTIGITILMFIMYRKETIKQFIHIGKPGLLIALTFASSTLCFTSAIQNTSISNTLVIVSTSPMFAALFSRIFLKENIKKITLLAMFIIFAAIASIMLNSSDQSSFFGDICAFGSAIFMATTFTITRRHKSTNMVPAMAASGIVASLVASALIASTGGTFMLASSAIPYLIAGGILISTAFALIMLGPRYMPAPEVGLIMPLETVFGSYLGWIFLQEKPSQLTLIVGIIVLSTLIIHAWLSLQQESKNNNF